ncbi:MAG: RNA-binding S4 domain-containing protein [Alphaproteobacteria bacterium]
MKARKINSSRKTDINNVSPAISWQRLDQWLWQAKFFKTRRAAQDYCAQYHVRINGVKVEKPDYHLRLGMVLTFFNNHHVRVIKVTALGGLSRQGFAHKQELYEDLDPPQPTNRLAITDMMWEHQKPIDIDNHYH